MFLQWRRRSRDTKQPRRVDPVCRMRVDEARARAAALVLRHNDQEYFFCREGCRRAFELAPDSYVGR